MMVINCFNTQATWTSSCDPSPALSRAGRVPAEGLRRRHIREARYYRLRHLIQCQREDAELDKGDHQSPKYEGVFRPLVDHGDRVRAATIGHIDLALVYQVRGVHQDTHTDNFCP